MSRKKDSTEVLRVRQSVARNKKVLLIYALIAVCGLVGWLASL